MKRWSLTVVFTLVAILALPVVLNAQTDTSQAKHEVTVQGTGFITKSTSDSGLTNNPTNSGGFLVGYRYHLNRWFAFEGDFDYFRNTQKYQSISSFSSVKTNGYAGTGSLVVKLPSSTFVKPYALVGGGGIVFDPRDTKGIDTQARATFVYGGGIDIPLIKRVALRTQYRGFVYKVPDFGISGLAPSKFTHTAVPSVGIVYTFK
jgi:opacity protein-like surface antigen